MVLPVEISDLKKHLNIDINDDDDLLLDVGFSFSPEGVEDNDAGGYDFKAIDHLMEISICAMPCNQNARIDAVKSLDVESIFEDATNFTTNLVTLRAEERLGFAVEDPNALSAGDFSIPTSSSSSS